MKKNRSTSLRKAIRELERREEGDSILVFKLDFPIHPKILEMVIRKYPNTPPERQEYWARALSAQWEGTLSAKKGKPVEAAFDLLEQSFPVSERDQILGLIQ